MSKREKIIVLLMLVVLGIGAYELFFAGVSGKKTIAQQGASQDLNQFMASAALELQKEKGREGVVAVAALDAGGWASDPFSDLESAAQRLAVRLKVAATEQREGPKMAYSGYLELGGTRLAIINGIEYQAGEDIEPGDYRLVEIHPNKVVLVRISGGSRVVVPIEEEALRPF